MADLLKAVTEFLGVFQTEGARLIAAFLIFVSVALIYVVRGYRQGRPTSPAVAAAIASTPPVCAAPEIGPALEKLSQRVDGIAHDLEELRHDQERNGQMLIRIEDRTRR
ncbi:hypothetical protein [Pseudooceanicola sp.]|uniref:hypothetical protein n=1 Tax=Pseudooceanicola sp. TaxID=1914328 RepID=UPI00405A366F